MKEKLERDASVSIAKSTRKLLILLVIVAICLAVLHFTPARSYLSDIEDLKANLRATGPFAPAVFFAISTFLSAIGFPRLGLTFAAGVLFGTKAGLAIALGSTLLGSYITFCVARWFAHDWARKMASKSDKFSFLMENQTVATVFLVRQLPITNIIINLMLSITHPKHSVFLLGSFLGFIPSALVATLSGSSLGKASPWFSFFQLSLAAVILLLIGLTVWRLKERWAKDYADQRN